MRSDCCVLPGLFNCCITYQPCVKTAACLHDLSELKSEHEDCLTSVWATPITHPSLDHTFPLNVWFKWTEVYQGLSSKIWENSSKGCVIFHGYKIRACFKRPHEIKVLWIYVHVCLLWGHLYASLHIEVDQISSFSYIHTHSSKM